MIDVSLYFQKRNRIERIFCIFHCCTGVKLCSIKTVWHQFHAFKMNRIEARPNVLMPSFFKSQSANIEKAKFCRKLLFSKEELSPEEITEQKTANLT